jgi:hypothetical protein
LTSLLSPNATRDTSQGVFQFSNPLKDLSVPRVDFNALIAEQRDKVRALKHQPIPPLSLKQRLASALEGPWAPESSDLPIRNQLGFAGTNVSFREDPRGPESIDRRRMVKDSICRSERVWPLSHWTSVYEYQVMLDRLPLPLHGLTILHLSDIHFLKSVDRPWKEMSRVADFLETGDQLTRPI